jgi:hypothetical protein
MTDRYTVRATWPDDTQEVIGSAEDMTCANRMLIAALSEGAVHAHVTDTQPFQAPAPAEV